MAAHIRGHSLEVRPGQGPEEGATRRDIEAWLKESMGGYTSEQLREAFRKVADSEHWKNDVDAVVPSSMRDILERAIPFHTGGAAVFEDLGGGRMRVRAPGYWANGMEG